MGEKLRSLRLKRRIEDLGPTLWQLAAGLCGLALAAGGVFGGLHPFGLALALGAGWPLAFSAGAGAALGYLALLPLNQSLRYLAAVAAALAGRAFFKEKFAPAALAGSGTLLLVQLMLSLNGLSDPAQAFGTLGDALLAAGLGFVLRQTGKTRSASAALAGGPGFLLGLMALPGLTLVPMGPLNLGVAVLGAVGLTLAYRGRLRDCCTVCVAGAAVLTAADPALCFMGLGVAAACLATAWFAPGERTGSAAVFLAVGLFGALAAPNVLGVLGLLGSMALAEVGFFAMPRRWLSALPGQVEVAAASQKPRVADAAIQLEGVAEALTGIADTVNQVYATLPKKGESYNWVVDHVAEELCRSCGQRESCWVENYSTIMDGFFQLKPVLEKQGRAALEQLPGQFCRCIHPVELCSATSRAYTLYRSRRESRVKAGAMRSALTEQYTAMAQALGQMAGQLGQALAPDEGKTQRLAAMMASIGLEPLEAQAGYDGAGRLRASLAVNRTSFKEEELEELRAEASRICHRALGQFRVSHSGPITTLTITEQALFCPVFGLAARPAKEGACGDAVEQFCDQFGNAHLLLCDGMGVGRPAAIDGALAANLAARLLRAGFCAESAARLVNVALSLKSDEESGATMDLITADLYTGRAKLFKAGGCPTFVVRGGKAEQLEGSSLPVGILSQVTGQQKALTLYEDQLVVLVSDGVLTDGTAWVAQQLELCAAVGSNPQEIADILADTARSRAGRTGHPDDITVAVMRLERAV